MRSAIILAVVMLLTTSVNGGAASYSRTITVAKSGGDFISPVEAMASIISASSTNPVLVKILPGDYDLGGTTLQMKEHVSVEGAGPDKTVLTGTIEDNNPDGCYTGIVNMANNSSISNIGIVNKAKEDNAGSTYFGIVVRDVKATVDRVSIKVGSDRVTGSETSGICAFGGNSLVTLSNSDIEIRVGSGAIATAALVLGDGNMTITDSKLVIFAQPDSTTRVVDCHMPINYSGTLTISNSRLEGNSAGVAGLNRGVDSRDCKAAIANSSITLKGGAESQGVVTGKREITINTSRIHSPGNAVWSEGDESAVRVYGSVVQGGITSLPGLTLKDNVDENNIPIPNR